MSCGNCFECDNCFAYCPDDAVLKLGPGGYEFDYDYCKGCGRCAAECPCGAIPMEPEPWPGGRDFRSWPAPATEREDRAQERTSDGGPMAAVKRHGRMGPMAESPSGANRSDTPAATQAVLEQLDEAECLRLIAPGGIGRIAYSGRFYLTILPVNYLLHEGSIVFRTAQDSLMGEDLQTGIADAEYRVAFEIDEIDMAAREGWSVLIHGPAHHLDSATERASALASGLKAWPSGEREHFIRITPNRITGRRIRRTGTTDPPSK